MKPASTSFLPVLATMLLSVCIAPSARADRAENAFVIVEGDGVVRLDGKNFAVLSDGAGSETTVTIMPQPGWQLLSPSRVKVKVGSPIPFQARSKSMEEIVNGTMTTIRIELTAYGCCRYVNGEEGVWDAAAEIPVPENKEENPGAFIHWNIDNDNNSTGGTTKHPGGDYLEHTTVSGENDLKKLGCALWSDKWSEVTTGFAILELKSASAAIWKSSQKGTSDIVVQPGSTKSWNLSDSSERADFYSLKDHLYVEGVDAGSCDIEFRFEVNGKSISDMVRYTFISANCGRQPTVGETPFSSPKMSKMVGCEFSITANADSNYNCIAWSIGKTDEYINPLLFVNGRLVSSYISPNGIKYVSLDLVYGNINNRADVDDILRLYENEKHLYPIATGPADAEIIYYDGFHAAVRRRCGCGAGKWIMFESKLGYKHRIEHLFNQVPTNYGNPIYYFK